MTKTELNEIVKEYNDIIHGLAAMRSIGQCNTNIYKMHQERAKKYAQIIIQERDNVK
jgi:dihydropteroate synthase